MKNIWIVNSVLVAFITIVFFGCTKKSPSNDEAYKYDDRYPTLISLDENALIVLVIQHSLRIPNNRIAVQIVQHGEEYSLIADSQPMNNFPEWQHTKSHKEISLSQEEYDRLCMLLQQINWKKLEKDDSWGLDGETWTLRFINNGDIYEVSLWSPDYEPSRDDLVLIKAVKALLLQAGFDYDELVPSES